MNPGMPPRPASVAAGSVAASFSETGRVQASSPRVSAHETTPEGKRGLSRRPTTGVPREVSARTAPGSPVTTRSAGVVGWAAVDTTTTRSTGRLVA